MMSTRGSLGKKNTCPAEESARESTNRRVLRRFAALAALAATWPAQLRTRSRRASISQARHRAPSGWPLRCLPDAGLPSYGFAPQKGPPPLSKRKPTTNNGNGVSFFGSALFCFSPKGGPIKRHTHMEGEEPSKRDTRRNPRDTAEAVGSGLSACRVSLGGQRDAERVRRAWVLGVSRLLKFQHIASE